MTPKEKAKELYNKFNPHSLIRSFYGDNIEIHSTKQCALIAVDEIIELENFSVEGREYWNEVKNEIINL